MRSILWAKKKISISFCKAKRPHLSESLTNSVIMNLKSLDCMCTVMKNIHNANVKGCVGIIFRYKHLCGVRIYINVNFHTLKPL